MVVTADNIKKLRGDQLQRLKDECRPSEWPQLREWVLRVRPNLAQAMSLVRSR